MTRERAVAILPVRLGSARLDGKALLAESGRPLFLETAQSACGARLVGETAVASDSDEVCTLARDAGLVAVATPPTPRSGSERCAAAMGDFPRAEILIDLQSDWPEVPSEDLDALVEALAGDEGPDIATLAARIDGPTDLADPNVVKLVTDEAGCALYFSRSPIPATGKASAETRRLELARRHVGVYAFRRHALAATLDLPDCALAETEGLEQLSWLTAGMRVRVLESRGRPRGIETRADYDAWLTRRAEVDEGQ